MRYPATVRVGDRTFEEGTNVPRLLLRRKFPGELHVFCPFRETRDAVRSGSLDVGAHLIPALRILPGLYGFDAATLRAAVARPDAFTVLLAVVYRLRRCHVLMSTRVASDDAGERAEGYHLQLFVDTHLDLCERMLACSLFSDDRVSNVDENPDDLSRSVAVQHEPRDDAVTGCGDLPDLTPLIDTGDIWMAVRPKTRIKTIVTEIVHIVGCKTLPHKCLLRNFADILEKSVKSHPALFALIRMALEISMLGNYPHAGFRPGFETRMRIRRSFADRAILTDDTLLAWMKDNDQLVLLATKELFMFMSEQQLAVDLAMQDTLPWAQSKGLIVGSMDAARSSIDRDSAGDDGFRKIAADLKLAHQQSMSYITKLKKASFVDIALQTMKRRFKKKEEPDSVSEDVRTCETALSDLSGADDGRFCRLLELMQRVVNVRVPERQTPCLELGWLKCFGMTRGGYAQIRLLYFEYETDAIADNRLQHRIADLFEACPKDFYLAHIYFNMICDKRAFASFALPTGYAENQTRALRASLCVPPWEPLPEDADRFFFCSTCEQWLSPVVESEGQRADANEYAIGIEQILYDHEDDRMYCARQKPAASLRKATETADGPGAAHTIRRHKVKKRCYDTEAVSVSMIGNCQRLGKKFWALCEVCGRVTAWSGANFGPLGFTCGRHDVPQPSAAPQPAPTVAIDADAEETPSGRRSRTETAEKTCYYCEAELDGKGTPLIVFDDAPRRLRYVHAALCKTHFDACAYLRAQKPVVSKSVLFRSVHAATMSAGTPYMNRREKRHVIEMLSATPLEKI